MVNLFQGKTASFSLEDKKTDKKGIDIKLKI